MLVGLSTTHTLAYREAATVQSIGWARVFVLAGAIVDNHPIVAKLQELNELIAEETDPESLLLLYEKAEIVMLVGDSLICRHPCVRCKNQDFTRMMLASTMQSSVRECLDCGCLEYFFITGIS